MLAALRRMPVSAIGVIQAMIFLPQCFEARTHIGAKYITFACLTIVE